MLRSKISFLSAAVCVSLFSCATAIAEPLKVDISPDNDRKDIVTPDWQNWRVIAFSAASIALVGFLYLTIVTAFTGRTLGMRLCSLRVVDARNGLIPTGGQSAARALVYLLSLVPAGILSLYVFVDSESKTIHDRLTRTAVIRA